MVWVKNQKSRRSRIRRNGPKGIKTTICEFIEFQRTKNNPYLSLAFPLERKASDSGAMISAVLYLYLCEFSVG
jgi:hypothetical protein